MKIQEGNMTEKRNPGLCVPWDGKTKKKIQKKAKHHKQLEHGHERQRRKRQFKRCREIQQKEGKSVQRETINCCITKCLKLNGSTV